MKRAIILILLFPAMGFGQVNPYGPIQNIPYVPTYSPPPPDARELRAQREKIVADFGPQSRDFVESYGEDAVKALSAVSKPVGVKLIEFAKQGLGQVAKPRGLLRVVGENSGNDADDIANWAMKNASKLQDADNMDAYLAKPLDYALQLKDLETGAAEMRSNRLNTQQAPPPQTFQLPTQWPTDWRVYAAVGGFALLVILWWRKRKTAALGA